MKALTTYSFIAFVFLSACKSSPMPVESGHTFSGWPQFADTAAMDHLPGIRLPVLLIDGEKDVPHITQSNDYMAKTIPGVRRVTIPAVGHMLNMESAEAFNNIVLEFLQNKATIKK